VDLRELLKKLELSLPIPAAAAAPSQTSHKTPDAAAVGADAAAPVDRSALAAISGGAAAAERDILMDFRRANDKDAEMLAEAVAENDIHRVMRAAHRITGASRMVGATGLAGACERLEHASRSNDWKTIEANMASYHQELKRLNLYFDSL
jgi:HPt (histidine-containing phosphotransfer) domain-containing protein